MEKAFEVERKGIDWITDEERRGTPRQLFWPWFAANASFFTVAYGVFVVGLGLSPWQGALAVVIGLGVSYPVVGVVALAGMRGGAPTMALSRAAFGVYVNRLPTLFVYLPLVGWETIRISIGALATRTVLARIDPSLATTPMVAHSISNHTRAASQTTPAAKWFFARRIGMRGISPVSGGGAMDTFRN